MYSPSSYNELRHYGVLGMKWGIRRYQNSNGSLTSAGKKRYKYTSWSTNRYNRKAKKALAKAAEHKRYADDYNPKNYIGKSKYTDKQRARDKKNMEKELAVAKKYTDKANKMQTRAKRSAEHDANMQKLAENQSAGKAFVNTALTTALTGNLRTYKSYMQMQAAGYSNGESFVATAMTGGLGGMLAKRLYITQDERSKRTSR